MSHEIYCPECHYANTPGSKFCNNCGTKLPLSTHIMCPNCSTANTRDRIFCDNCGSRLVPDEKPKPDEPEVQEPATGSGAFTLPTRKPGETGELDPSKLPDWLSRQMSEKAQQAEEDDEDIPNIEEFQSDKRQTDDLPDWLIHDSDPEPIINAPTTISTEFFLDLVDKADDLPDLDELMLDQDDDLMQGAKDANLPDWLSEANNIPDNTRPPAANQSLPEPDEIFSDIGDDSLFAGLDSEFPAEEDDEDEPDWLSEEVASDAQDDGGMTEWLSDLEETTAESLTHDVNEVDEGTGLTEWLADLDSGELSTEAAEPEIDLFNMDGLEETAVADEDADDWLTDLSADETETAVPAEPPTIYTESFPEPDEGDSENWWGDFTDDEDEEIAPTAESTESAVLDTIPESDEDEDSWWDDFADENEEITIPATADTGSVLDEIPESDEDDGWWDDLAETVEPESPPAVDHNEDTEDTEDTAVPEWETVTDEQFDTLFAGTPAEETDLPDWLSAASEESGSLVGDQAEEPSAESLRNTQHLIQNAETDWLADLEGVASETPELSGVFLGLDDEDDSFIDDLAAPFIEDESESEPDWFSDLPPVDTGQLLREAEADLENLPTPSEEPALELHQPEEEAISEPFLEDDNWDVADEDFFAMEEGDNLPEWINQLGDPSSITDSSPPPLSSDEELPDWIASMRPEDNAVPSEMGGSLSGVEPDFSDSLEGLPFDLAGGDLPDWLTPGEGSGDIAQVASELGGAAIDQNPEIPDWLKADNDEGEPFTGGEGDDNWVSMLDNLPGVIPPAAALAKADIPAWVEELKPAELDDDKTGKRRLPEGPEEKEGPLAGLRGVVAVETATIQPHTIEPVRQFLVTPEQKEQVALLQQILHEETGSGTVIAGKADAHVSAALRIVLSILLIGAVVLGLRTVSLAKASFSEVPAPVAAVNTAVTNAANTPVLVAFDYPPAMSGELSPQAETLLQQLAAQNSAVVIVSQYPSATGIIADALGSEYEADNLGYLPGNAIGLRQLSDCLTGQSACNTLVGKSVPDDTRQKLKNVGLIVVLTGNKESLTNWIEQVGTKSDVAISAGVTTALAPSASPYYATSQLSGYLGGLLDTAVYQDLIDDKTQNVSQLLNAQLLGQILVATILLVGLIIYGISGSLSKRGKSKRS